MNLKERRSKFGWARGSTQARKVALMQKEWIGRVKDAKCLASLALKGKEAKKMKKNERSLKLLEKCKEHGVTHNTTEILESLNDK